LCIIAKHSELPNNFSSITEEYLSELEYYIAVQDESALIWYSGSEEKRLWLNAVSRIVPGQRTAVFQRYPRPEKEYQSFSLIHSNDERSLDLVSFLSLLINQCWFPQVAWFFVEVTAAEILMEKLYRFSHDSSYFPCADLQR
jgi:hypothetical protein